MNSKTYELLASGIATHVGALNACNGQAREIFHHEEAAHRTDRPELRSRLALQRSVHELEAAVHASTLTQTALALASLEAAGVDVERLFKLLAQAPK